MAFSDHRYEIYLDGRGGLDLTPGPAGHRPPADLDPSAPEAR
ncbi:hypothetical protein [Streptosporangium roseum]